MSDPRPPAGHVNMTAVSEEEIQEFRAWITGLSRQSDTALGRYLVIRRHYAGSIDLVVLDGQGRVQTLLPSMVQVQAAMHPSLQPPMQGGPQNAMRSGVQHPMLQLYQSSPPQSLFQQRPPMQRPIQPVVQYSTQHPYQSSLPQSAYQPGVRRPSLQQPSHMQLQLMQTSSRQPVNSSPFPQTLGAQTAAGRLPTMAQRQDFHAEMMRRFSLPQTGRAGGIDGSPLNPLINGPQPPSPARQASVAFPTQSAPPPRHMDFAEVDALRRRNLQRRSSFSPGHPSRVVSPAQPQLPQWPPTFQQQQRMSPPTTAVGPTSQLGQDGNIPHAQSGLSDEQAQALQNQNRELKTESGATVLKSATELVQPIVDGTSDHVVTVAELEDQGFTAPDLRRALLLAVNEGMFGGGDAAIEAVQKRWVRWKGRDEDDADVGKLGVEGLRAVLVKCCKDVQTLRKGK